MSIRPRLRHYIEATPLWLIPKLLRPLPFRLRVRMGGAVISALVRWVPNLRKRVKNNLTLIYPTQPVDEQNRLFRAIARNIGGSYIEMLYSQTTIARLSEFHLQSDLSALKTASQAGQPIILVSAHFGSWDAIRAVIGEHIAPVSTLFKRPENPILGKRYEVYVNGGLPMFEATPRGMAEMVRYLKAGGITSILTDQRVDDGEWIDFMGKPALTALSAAKLAIRANALLVPCYGVRRANFFEVDVHLEPPITHGDPVEMTRTINDSITARVLENPEQWYWLHKRWKSRSAQAADNA